MKGERRRSSLTSYPVKYYWYLRMSVGQYEELLYELALRLAVESELLRAS